MPINWPEAIDDVVLRARFYPGDEVDWWQASEKIIEDLPDDQLRYLATVGLAELVTQTHRIDRDRQYLCIGDRLVIARHPELEPYISPSSADS